MDRANLDTSYANEKKVTKKTCSRILFDARPTHLGGGLEQAEESIVFAEECVKRDDEPGVRGLLSNRC